MRQADGLVDLYVDGEVISTTAKHPFWVPDKGWVEAKDLQVGSLLQTEDERVVDVDRVEKREGKFEVYNFKVEDFHTYFVSDLGVLVHNADCIPDEPVGSLKKVDAKWLKKQGVDPHDLKDSVPGKMKEFDIYKDRDNNLWAVRKPEYNPDAVPEYLGNLDNFREIDGF